MAKMWAGRSSGATDAAADSFNSSIGFDKRMYVHDIEGSMAHAAMLGVQGIIKQSEADAIIDALARISDDISSGELEIDLSCEDIHMFVEQVLTERIGALGKKLHTARSRNDQVALDTRLYLRQETDEVIELLKDLVSVLLAQAEANRDTVMPGFTHMQHAQPVLFSHHMLAYTMMFIRDAERFADSRKRCNVSPIGACALAGTSFNTDRVMEATQLGFDGVCLNSLDAVSDRDFCIEFSACAATAMMHLSRLSEELILWSSQEFAFVEMSDDYTTGSSIMPQKKNPDMAELCRGKTGRVYGNLMSILTVMKGIPLAYNKDMQEDKEALFDTVDTIKACLSITSSMIESMSVRKDNMLAAAKKGFMNATDLADYLVRKGMPFRDAYKVSGSVVADCISSGLILEDFPLERYKQHSDLFDGDLYKSIDILTCVNARNSLGGTSIDSVDSQIEFVKSYLKDNR